MRMGKIVFILVGNFSENPLPMQHSNTCNYNPRTKSERPFYLRIFDAMRMTCSYRSIIFTPIQWRLNEAASTESFLMQAKEKHLLIVIWGDFRT